MTQLSHIALGEKKLTQKHVQSTAIAIQASLIAIVSLFSTNADAVDALNIKSWATANQLDTYSNTITATDSLEPVSFINDPATNKY